MKNSHEHLVSDIVCWTVNGFDRDNCLLRANNDPMTVLLSILLMTSASALEPLPSKEISAVVRLIRAHPETEVFFKDYKDSAIIARNSKHNQFFDACERSRKSGVPVRLIVHPVSRQVISLGDEPGLQPPVTDDKETIKSSQ